MATVDVKGLSCQFHTSRLYITPPNCSDREEVSQSCLIIEKTKVMRSLGGEKCDVFFPSSLLYVLAYTIACALLTGDE